MTHTLQQDFEHFLSYSGLSSESEDVKAKLLKAYEANWRPLADLDSQAIWGLAVQFAGTQVQWTPDGDNQILVFETPEAFADCFRDVLYFSKHPDTIRLDWLQSKMHKSSIRLADMRFTTVNAWAVTADGEDLRATIDAIKALEDK